ncbi:MAG: hypothetical protein Q9214_004957 [Letrouitia sp. 1 TL-2023]
MAPSRLMDTEDNSLKVGSPPVNGFSFEEFTKETLKRLLQTAHSGPGEEGEESFFMADMGEVYRQYLRWNRHLPMVQPYYDSEVIRLLAALGTGFDCSSRREMEVVLALGVAPERIIYANPCKRISHLEYARTQAISKMTFDSLDELHKIKKIYPGAELLLRIMVDDSSSHCPFDRKFGASLSSTGQLLRAAKTLDLDVIGVSFHIGTSAVNPLAFVQAVQDSRAVFNQALECGYSLRMLDVGGGFSHESFESMSQALAAALNKHFQGDSIKLIAEPGRYFVSSAFAVACNIIARREASDDDGERYYMLYLSDGVYGSFMDFVLSHWHREPQILACSNESSSSAVFRYKIWGPTCDGTDRLVERAYLDKLLDVGDWLYFTEMGAYSTCLSTSFNGFPHERKVHHVSSEPAASALLHRHSHGGQISGASLHLHEGNELYHDEDGSTTREANIAFVRGARKQITSLIAVSFVGLAVNTAAAIVVEAVRDHALHQSVKSSRWWLFERSIRVVAAIFLAFQSLIIAQNPSSISRHSQGVVAGLSFIFFYAASLWYDLHDVSTSRLQIPFFATHLLLMVISTWISWTIPRRPQVFHQGQLNKTVDGERTVSLLSRLTLSWANPKLSYAMRKGGVDFEDLCYLTANMSTNALVSSISRFNAYRLWKTIALAHRSVLVCQWTLTLCTSIAVLAPQYFMWRLIRVLEQSSTYPEPIAGLWLALLGFAQLLQPWIDAWVLWIGWCHIALPINVQLSGLIVAKSMRKKDVSDAGHQDEDFQYVDVQQQKDPKSKADATIESESADGNVPLKAKQDEINLISVDVQRISDFMSYNGMSVAR